MYSQWLRLCDENRSLVNEKVGVLDLKNKAEKRLREFEVLVAEKNEKIEEISTKLKTT